MFLIEEVLGSKNLLSESCSQRPYYYIEVISVFDLGVPRPVCLPPKGEGKQNVARIKKLISQKLFRAAILL